MNDLDKLLEQWNTEKAKDFSDDPGAMIILGDQVISKLQARIANMEKIEGLRRKARIEEMESWLAKYGIPYDCGWRDAIDELIIDTAIKDDIAMRFFNALNDAGIKYRLAPDGSIDYLDETERAKGDEIARRIEAEAGEYKGQFALPPQH